MTTDMKAIAEFRFRPDHMNSPGHLSSLDDVDVLIEEIIAGSTYENLAQITHLARGCVKPNIPGHDLPELPDHDFQVGVDRELQVAVLLFIDDTGNYVSEGSPDSRSAPVYYLAGHRTEFRDQVEIPIDIAREAVKEFLLTKGRRPTFITWKNQYPEDDLI
ncbi:Imm1 family immunity protein [Kitasatospora sp. NPDC057542]|uniref:Imm1 family immunity protein n=1 Tax=Kitasatospora sp. NPDC057542 TaxID=3346162 RepID=UPI0036C74C45